MLPLLKALVYSLLPICPTARTDINELPGIVRIATRLRTQARRGVLEVM